MDDIVSQVRRVAQLIGDMGSALHEQAGGIAQVSEALSQLDHHTQQNAALVEETAAAAQHLSEQAQRLEDAAHVFRVEAGLAADAPATAGARPPVRTQAPAAAPRPVARVAAARPALAPAAPAARPAPSASAAQDQDEWEQF
jgi:methyl-accepting chemotaxis protein